MSLADAKALMDDFEVVDAAIAAAKEESVTREAALAAALAEAEAGAATRAGSRRGARAPDGGDE